MIYLSMWYMDQEHSLHPTEKHSNCNDPQCKGRICIAGIAGKMVTVCTFALILGDIWGIIKEGDPKGK